MPVEPPPQNAIDTSQPTIPATAPDEVPGTAGAADAPSIDEVADHILDHLDPERRAVFEMVLAMDVERYAIRNDMTARTACIGDQVPRLMIEMLSNPAAKVISPRQLRQAVATACDQSDDRMQRANPPHTFLTIAHYDGILHALHLDQDELIRYVMATRIAFARDEPLARCLRKAFSANLRYGKKEADGKALLKRAIAGASDRSRPVAEAYWSVTRAFCDDDQVGSTGSVTPSAAP